MTQPRPDAMRSARRIAAALVAALLLGAVSLLPMGGASAVEVPAAGDPWYIQTNGPAAAVTLGDWYTSTTAGAGSGQHYLEFNVPCGWPSSLPVDVDLFSPEMNRVAGALALSEEPSGAYDSTQFELYGPGVTVGPGFSTPAPGTGIAGTRTTFEPGAVGVAESWQRFATLPAPVACGTYAIRSEVLANDPANPGGTGDDQNGWRARIGFDNNADPTDAPPANYDNPDGVAGTNDEITSGLSQITFQHDAGATVCRTFFQFVDPGQASVTFNNFDMDGSGRVRYYAPGDPTYDPNANTGGTAGTVSANGVWNGAGGTLALRKGDTINTPAAGWWRLATCASSHNQLIQEGQTGMPIYYAQPPTPTLAISKTDGVTNASPGQTLMYDIDVDNTSSGPSAGAATNVVVHDTIPTGTSYGSCSISAPASGTWTCSQAGGVVTFTQTGWIAAGETATFHVTVTANQGISGSLTNTAKVDYGDALGNTYPQQSATDVDTVVPEADLQIVKTDSADPVNPGDAFDYDLAVTDNGPADATSLSVSDPVPSGLAVTGVTTGTGSCSFVGNAVSCARAALASGATWTIHVHVLTSASDPGTTYHNTASVSGAENDPNLVNNSDDEFTTVQPAADLAITKVASADPVDPGDTFDYTFTVTNNGPSDATTVAVDDTVPAGLTVTGVTTGTGACSAVGNHVSCSRTTLVNGGTWSIVVHVSVPAANGGGTFTDTATVTADQADPTPGNNSDSFDTHVGALADLAIVKTDSADPVDPGDAFDYTLNVTNDGPADATNVAIDDPVPAGLIVTGFTTAIGSCTVTGNDVACTRAALANGAGWAVVVHVQARANDPGTTYTNIAAVAADQADPDMSNNTSSQDTTVATVADVGIVKADSLDPAAPGQIVNYTLTATDHGPADVTNVAVHDTVPAGLTVTSATVSTGSCVVTGNDVDCTRATLANGASWVITVHTIVDLTNGGGTFTDTATVNADQTDPDLTNNTASEDTTVPVVADVGIVKTDSADPVLAGDAFNYLLVVTNHGPATATNVHVTDPVPSGLTVTGTTPGAGACTVTGQLVDCTLGSLVSAGTWSITVNISTSPSDPGSLYTNTASVSADQLDTNASNDSDPQSTTVGAVADLGIVKTDSRDPAKPGQTVDYRLAVVNHGPSDATNVVLTDNVPAGLTVTGVSGGTGSCSHTGNAVSCTLGGLVNGAGWTIVVQTTVDASNQGGTFSDTAHVLAEQTDPNQSNNHSTAHTTVPAVADLEVTKTADVSAPKVGQIVTYTIRLTNHGPADATGVKVGDVLPDGLTYVSSKATKGSYASSSGVWTVGGVANGVTDRLTIRTRIDASAVGKKIENHASVVMSDQIDPSVGNDVSGIAVDVKAAGGGTGPNGGGTGGGTTASTGANTALPAAAAVLLAIFGLAAILSARERRRAR